MEHLYKNELEITLEPVQVNNAQSDGDSHFCNLNLPET